MKNEECIHWLKKCGILDFGKKYTDVFKNIFKNCLKVDNEKVVIIGDTGCGDYVLSSVMAANYYFAAKELGLDVDFIMQSGNKLGRTAERVVVDQLKNLPEKNIIIANMSNRLGSFDSLGTKLKKFSQVKGHRYINTPSLGFVPLKYLPYYIKALNVDYDFIRHKHKVWLRQFEETKEIQVKTPAGTDINFNIMHRKFYSSDGLYDKPGKGGNLPVGEIYIAPNEKKTEGKFVIDGSSRNRLSTHFIKSPITVYVEKGSITEIDGEGQEANLLRESIKWAEIKATFPNKVRVISELGIGSNPWANIIGSTILDEKVLGTCHIAIGGNTWFGGTNNTIIHFDQVMRNPEIYADGKRII